MIGHGFVNGMTGGRLPFSKPLSQLQTCLRSFISLIMHKQDNHVHGGELSISKNTILRGFWDEREICEKPRNSGTPKKALYMGYLLPTSSSSSKALKHALANSLARLLGTLLTSSC